MATCGYTCPKCEGSGYMDNWEPCDWCSTEPVIDINKEPEETSRDEEE